MSSSSTSSAAVGDQPVHSPTVTTTSATSQLSSLRFIDGKYDDIYAKRSEIEAIRNNPNLSNEDKIKNIQQELENLNRLEHDLVLLQHESYETLEDELNLFAIKLVTGFPKYHQYKNRRNDAYVLRLSALEGLISSPLTSPSQHSRYESGTQDDFSQGISRTQETFNAFNTGTLTRNRSNTFDNAPYLKKRAQSLASGHESFRYLENVEQAKKLKEEIRLLRAELFLLKKKKKLSTEEEDRTIELEEEIKDKENIIIKN